MVYRVIRKNHVALLGYHSVSRESNKAQTHNAVYAHLSVPTEMFERQMRWLQRQGYEFLRFSDLKDIREGKRFTPRRAALIYFDDGYKDNRLNAYPILKLLKIPATVFVATDCIDQKRILWDADVHPVTAHMFLSWDDLRAMTDVFDIGSHTVTHRKLTSLSLNEIREEFDQSKRRIYEMTGKKAVALSYPKSRWNADVRRIADEAGFEFVLAHGRGFRHSGDFRHLEKIPIGPEDSSLRSFKLKLGMYYPFLSHLRWPAHS